MGYLDAVTVGSVLTILGSLVVLGLQLLKVYREIRFGGQRLASQTKTRNKKEGDDLG